MKTLNRITARINKKKTTPLNTTPSIPFVLLFPFNDLTPSIIPAIASGMEAIAA
jgi:hypothetical protein